MTPEEDAALFAIGVNIRQNLLVAIFMSLFYGAYLLIFPAVIIALFRKGMNRTANRVMFALAMVTFISTAMFWVTYVAEYSAIITGNLMEHTDIPLGDRLAEITKDHIQKFMIILWPQLINFMTGDGIVVWRVWVLYSERPWVRILLVALWFLTLVAYTTYTSWRQHLMSKFGSPAFDSTAETLQVICFSMSAGTNIISVLLVGFKAWEFRRIIRETSGVRGNRTLVQRCLDLLTESGMVYCVVQLTFLILNSCNGTTAAFNIATHVSVESAIILGAIYPLLTILLVASSRSLSQTANVESPTDTYAMSRTTNDSFLATQKSDVTGVQYGQYGMKGPMDTYDSRLE